MSATLAGREEGFLSKTLALARKDIRVELRSRDTLPPMLAFSIAVVLLLAFSLPSGTQLTRRASFPIGTVPMTDVLAGFLWVTVLFAGLVAFARTFGVEREGAAMDPLLLAPVDRSALYLAKALANFAYITVVQVFLLPVFLLMFQIDLGGGGATLIGVVVLVDIGFVAVGTLFAALAAQTTSRELMLPILALPMLVPVFIAAVELTSDLFGGGGFSDIAERGWFGLLIGFDIIFTIVGALAFEFAVDN
ncbi:MAG: heme exporter protein CcmB [Actinomycetota bacterium]